MSAPGVRVRQLAAEALAGILGEGRSMRAVLPAPLDALGDSRDRALLEALLFAACRGLPRYRAALALLLPRRLPARQRRIEAALLIGLAQLEALQLPAHAAIASTAELARVWKQPQMVGLINAVLRRWLREGPALAARLEADDEARLAHPRWLIERIRSDWPEQADALFAANNGPGPMWLRLHPRGGARSDWLQRLSEAGIEAFPGPPTCPRAIRLPRAVPPGRLPGWEDGLLAVQDAAAQAVTELLEAGPGLRVLDACAAPGGKSAALLERWPGIELLSLDRDPARVARMREGLARLGHAPRTVVGDAGQPADWWDGRPFERILLDVPCSATGVIRRQPDIKLHRRPADITALAVAQGALLAAAWPLLAPGGRLVYTTCSVLREENEAPLAAFLAAHPEAQPLALPEPLGHACGIGRQRLPGEQDMDGFFYAALGKPL